MNHPIVFMALTAVLVAPMLARADAPASEWTPAQLEVNVRGDLLRDGQDLARLGFTLKVEPMLSRELLISLERDGKVTHQRLYGPPPTDAALASAEVKQIVQGFLATSASPTTAPKAVDVPPVVP